MRYGAFCLGLATLVLAGCNYHRTPNFAVEAPRFRVLPDYRQRIVAWTKRYYVEPDSVRFLAITEPIPVLVAGGVPVSQQVRGAVSVWLVCVELDARERGGPYMGPRRIAFGLGPGFFSAPMERGQVDTHNNLDLQNNDCDARQLTWREWRGDEASAARRRYRRR